MNLKDFKIIPGVVIDVADPKFIGRVKADAPGLFNSEVMNKEGLPWIYPFVMPGYQRFSKLNNGSKIWIMTNNDYHEFWYWPMFELNEDTRNIISKDESNYQEAEVLLSRNMGDVSVYIYYSPSDGIMIKQGENTFIQLTPDNKIITKAGDGQVLIENNNVYIGDTETSKMQKTVMGDNLVQMLNALKSALEQLQTLSMGGYTANLIPGFAQAVQALQVPLTNNSLLTKKTNVD